MQSCSEWKIWSFGAVSCWFSFSCFTLQLKYPQYFEIGPTWYNASCSALKIMILGQSYFEALCVLGLFSLHTGGFPLLLKEQDVEIEIGTYEITELQSSNLRSDLTSEAISRPPWPPRPPKCLLPRYTLVTGYSGMLISNQRWNRTSEAMGPFGGCHDLRDHRNGCYGQ